MKVLCIILLSIGHSSFKLGTVMVDRIFAGQQVMRCKEMGIVAGLFTGADVTWLFKLVILPR